MALARRNNGRSLAADFVEAEVVEPNPANLIESLRDFGYTLPTAIADLVDNSITASAKNIRIDLNSSGASPHIVVIDDGDGMDLGTLIEAMRLSGHGPAAERDVNDLGRFGLGLKTASLSQGTCLTVITKKSGVLSIRRWDLEHIRRSSEWQLLASPSEVAADYVPSVAGQESGTAVVIEGLDRLSFLTAPEEDLRSHLADQLTMLCSHLGMVFHRFLSEDGLVIRVGEGRVAAWDPFLIGRSQQKPTETIGGHADTAEVTITPFILPHYSKIDDELHSTAGGPMGWNAHQGFYVYRGRRLIVPGSWLNLKLKKEEHYKLARLRVDLPNTLDSEWHLNVIKSHVAAPACLRDCLKRIANFTRKQASEVYRMRGERQAPATATTEHFIWRRKQRGKSVRFEVDRAHPVIRSLLHAGCEHDDLLEKVVRLLENTLPVAAIVQNPQHTLNGVQQELSEEQLSDLVDLARHAELHFIRIGRSPNEARQTVLTCNPFLKHRKHIETVLGS